MLTLHFAPNSRAGRIVWLLEELALPYDINKMAFHPQDLKSDAHRARHPLGRVPVLDDGYYFRIRCHCGICVGSTQKRRVETGGDRQFPVFAMVPLLRRHGDAAGETCCQIVSVPPDRRDEGVSSRNVCLPTLEPVNAALKGGLCRWRFFRGGYYAPAS